MLKTVSSVSNALGALNYKGTWNASINSPTLVSSVGTKGDYYVVSVAGSTNLNGVTLWGVGDWAVFNGSVWQKVDGGDTTNITTLTVTSLTGYMYANNTSAVTASVTIPNNGLANSNVIIGNTTITLGSTVTSIGNVTLANANISATTGASATFATSSLPLVPAGYISILLNGTTVKIPYYAV
jgi:hypothetical protein